VSPRKTQQERVDRAKRLILLSLPSESQEGIGERLDSLIALARGLDAPVDPLSDAARQAVAALRDAEDGLVNGLFSVGRSKYTYEEIEPIWKWARELVDTRPDWSTQFLDLEDPYKDLRYAFIQDFKAIQSVRDAIVSLLNTGLVADEVQETFEDIVFIAHDRS
jgi:hypothetical protein